MDTIINRYDPEHDTMSDGPLVTWAEFTLALELKAAKEQIRVLARELADLASAVSTLTGEVWDHRDDMERHHEEDC
jgi:hypothetical protein